MPNESFCAHLLSIDVIEAVLTKVRDVKVKVGYSPNDFLTHLTNYYMHICVNVNNSIRQKNPPSDFEKSYLESSQSVLKMVETIIEKF